jgi:hypothetical protein
MFTSAPLSSDATVVECLRLWVILSQGHGSDHAVGWVDDEIDEWLASRLAARRPATVPLAAADSRVECMERIAKELGAIISRCPDANGQFTGSVWIA